MVGTPRSVATTVSVKRGRSGIFIIAPMSSGDPTARFRIEIEFQGRAGRVLPDQVRAVARGRLIRRLGRLDDDALDQVLSVLRLMFEPD